jgi:golgi phosphoprotein 3
MDSLLLSEELLLLALDDDTGANRAQWSLDAALAGAVLLDLIGAGALREEDGDLVADAGHAPVHPVLADALAAIAADDRPRSAKHWVSKLPRRVKPLKGRVAERLVDRGILSGEDRRTLGLFRTTRYVEADPSAERDLRERLSRALLGDGEADERTALLVALLQPTELVARVVPRDRRKEAKARAKEIAERGAVGDAVNDAIRGVQAAIIATATAAATSASTSSGG